MYGNDKKKKAKLSTRAICASIANLHIKKKVSILFKMHFYTWFHFMKIAYKCQQFPGVIITGETNI